MQGNHGDNGSTGGGKPRSGLLAQLILIGKEMLFARAGYGSSARAKTRVDADNHFEGLRYPAFLRHRNFPRRSNG